MAGSATMAGMTVASAKVNKLVSAAATAQASVSANAHIDKLIQAAALAAASVSVSALLGKRLQGALTAYATTEALASLSVNMGASLSTDSSSSSELLLEANMAASLLATVIGQPMVYVERSIKSDGVAVSVSVAGKLVFTHLVSAEVGGHSYFEQSFTSIFVEAELVDTWMNHITIDVDPSARPLTASAELFYPSVAQLTP
jgi:hypothetical protein